MTDKRDPQDRWPDLSPLAREFYGAMQRALVEADEVQRMIPSMVEPSSVQRLAASLLPVIQFDNTTMSLRRLMESAVSELGKGESK